MLYFPAIEVFKLIEFLETRVTPIDCAFMETLLKIDTGTSYHQVLLKIFRYRQQPHWKTRRNPKLIQVQYLEETLNSITRLEISISLISKRRLLAK